MTINERIRELRKSLKYSQSEFGERITFKKSAVCRLESDGYAVSDRSIQLICTAFHISEAWLRYGEGDMHTEDKVNVIEQLAREYDLTPAMVTVIEVLCGLEASQQTAVVEFAKNLVNRIQEAEARRKAQEEAKKTKAAAHPEIIRPDNVTDEQWETMLAALEASELEKSTQESPASISGSSATQKEA